MRLLYVDGVISLVWVIEKISSSLRNQLFDMGKFKVFCRAVTGGL